MKPSFSNLEVIQFAIGMEESGIEFYENHAKEAKGEVKEVFLKLADDERRHAAIFQKMMDEASVGEANFGYFFEEEVTAFFADYARSEGFSRQVTDIHTVKEALAEGIATESITIAYYENLLKFAKGESVPTLQALIVEEESHLSKLKQLYDREA